MKKFFSFLFGLCLLVLLLPRVCLGFDVTLAWSSSISPNISYYTMHWSTQSGVYDNEIDVGLSFEGPITNLINGTMYYFTVSCTDTWGQQSGFSNEVFADGTVVSPGDPPFPPETGCYIKSMTP